jgi:glutamyl-tRNA reductase
MRQREGESYEDWAKRVQMYEHGWAMQRIAEGANIDQVLDAMSRKIMQKLLHPLYKEIENSIISTYDAEAGKKEYEEKYLKYRAPVADHVEGHLFDKNE